MRTRHAMGAICCVVATAFAGCGSSSKSSTTSRGTSSRPFSPAVQAKLRQALQSFVGNGKFPGLVAAVSTPQGSWVYATGYSDLATHAPLSANEYLRIGSITKTFTATVILQLAQQRKLSLNDPLSKYEPQIRAAASITLRELLNMTSGLRHGSPSRTPQQTIANTVKKPPLSPPGKAYHYSDVGYLILGEVAQKVTGTDIGTLIQRQILSPLGLHHTVYAAGTTLPSPTAHGFRYVSGKPIDVTNSSAAWTGSAGSMASTVGDMKAWAPTLATGKGILSPGMQQQRLQMVNAGPGLTYGLGIFQLNGLYGHDGSVMGYDSVALYSPKTNVTIVVLGNTSPLLNRPSQPNLETFPFVAAALIKAISSAVGH